MVNSGMKQSRKIIVTVCGGLFALAIAFYAVHHKPHHIQWAAHVDAQTLADSWGTWNKNYRQEVKPTVNHTEFFDAVARGSYRDLSVEEFLRLPVENQRLNKYQYAKTPEEVYPLNDRPRDQQDIESVQFLMTTELPISPICVAKVIDKDGQLRYIKLDGVHRLVAAMLTQSMIRVFFIEL